MPICAAPQPPSKLKELIVHVFNPSTKYVSGPIFKESNICIEHLGGPQPIRSIVIQVVFENRLYEVEFLNNRRIVDLYLKDLIPDTWTTDTYEMSIVTAYWGRYGSGYPTRWVATEAEIKWWFGTTGYLFPMRASADDNRYRWLFNDRLRARDIGFPPHGTHLSSICRANVRVRIYADGAGGTYEENDPDDKSCCFPEGQLLEEFCKGVDRWGRYANGDCTTREALIKTNSTDCGYKPCEPAGKEIRKYCVGKDQWVEKADGNCGVTNTLFKANSTDCGYVPCPAHGVFDRTYCKGTTKYNVYHDGNCGSYEEVAETNSPGCGYVPCEPAGKEIRKYCIGEDQWVEKADGNCGVVRSIYKANSPDCGYDSSPAPAKCTEFTPEEWVVVQNYNKASQYLEWISRYISCTDVVAPGYRKNDGTIHGVDARYVTFTDDKGVTWTLGHSVGLPIERNGTIEYAPPHEDHASRNPIHVRSLDANLSQDYINCATGVYDSETWKYQYWSICSVSGLDSPVTQVQRRCCTCGSGSTNVLMDNFVFAVNDQWFNDTLAQYVETGAFAARLLPSNGATPNTIAPQWILTLKGCTTNPTKPEVRRKMDVYLKSIKEFLTESKQKYKNFDETQVVKIISAYNGSEFGIKMEDCNGTIATIVVTREICPKAGEVVKSYCVGFDRWKTYTDGNCGVYHQLVKANSDDCGYVPCEPAGRKIGTYCEGFDQWAFFTDGNCGKTPVKLHENSEDCGYIPCDKGGTVYGTKCKGFDLYDIVADGDCGTEDVLNTPNSPDCGYIPCDKRGIVTGTKCKGFDLYDIVTDGDCGTEDVLNTPNSPDCGYVPCDPAGKEIRKYCEGNDRWAEYSDGKCGTTRTLLMANSPECGYVPCDPAGKEIRKYCEGNDQWAEYSDGNCGTTRTMIMANSPSCMTPYERSITYSASKTTMRPDDSLDSGVYTWNFSGYPPNTRVPFQVWARSSNTKWANSGDRNTFNDIVNIGSNGTGVFTLTYSFLDSDILPGGGDVYNWAIDPANNVRSNTVKVTYVP